MKYGKWASKVHILMTVSLLLGAIPVTAYADVVRSRSTTESEEASSEDSSQEETQEESQDTSSSVEESTESSNDEQSNTEEDKKDSEDDSTSSSSATTTPTARKNSKGQYTNDYIEQSEASKSEAEKQKKELKSNLTDIKSMLASLEKAKADLAGYIEELDEDLDDINEKIEALEQLITDKEFEIETTKIELAEAEEVRAKQYATMKKRVKFMYEKGNSSYLEMLTSARSFVDFLNKAEFIGRLSAYDRRMLDDFIASENEVRDTKAKLEEQEVDLKETKEAVEAEKEAFETLIESKQEEIVSYESDIDNKEEAIAEYEAMIAEQDAVIKEIEKAIEAERQRLIEENEVVRNYDGGVFAWPAPSYTRISDDYGNRIHPTLKTQQFHNGVDMAAPSGSPILAAYDGKVIAASYSATMGNYIMIDHGDNVITIYMHASSLGVSEGQEVSRGQQIGKVGSTGRSTGPHLHFSVRKNGSYVSPWGYLGK